PRSLSAVMAGFRPRSTRRTGTSWRPTVPWRAGARSEQAPPHRVPKAPRHPAYRGSEVTVMDARKLIGAIESAGYEARSYSGRGMFGKECVGAEVSRDESAFALAAKLVLAVFDEDGDEEAYNFASD